MGLFVHECVQTLTVVDFTLMLILDCLRRVLKIAAISISLCWSHPPPRVMCGGVCVADSGHGAIIASRCHPTRSLHPSVSLISS